MRFRFNRELYHKLDEGLAGIGEIRALLDTLIRKEATMSAELDALTAQVAANGSAIDSAITLITNLAAKIAGGDPATAAALTALAADLKTKDDALAAAVAAQTPGA